MSSTIAKLRRAAESASFDHVTLTRAADTLWPTETVDRDELLARYGLDDGGMRARLAGAGITQLPYYDAIVRAEARGFDNAHAFMAYRTKLRADYAATFARKAHQPATYLPIMHAFRSTVPTAEVGA